jgi:flagellar FliL protein
MANAAAAPVQSAEVAAPPAGSKVGLIGALTFVGALAGGLIASLVVAPSIIARQSPAAAHADSAAAESGDKGEGKGGEGAGSEKKMVELANIIVNPAGSQGTRFLMASVAISVASEEAQKILSDHEVELRDRVTSILEAQTMAQLTMPGARDSLKVKIAQAAGVIVGPKVPLKVFLPQYVIQ